MKQRNQSHHQHSLGRWSPAEKLEVVRKTSHGAPVALESHATVKRAAALPSLSCGDRQVMSFVTTAKGFDAGLIGDLMMRAVEDRFGPDTTAPDEIEWLDNGSCHTASGARSYAGSRGLKPVTAPVRSLKSNGVVGSFVKTIKRYYAMLAFGRMPKQCSPAACLACTR